MIMDVYMESRPLPLVDDHRDLCDMAMLIMVYRTNVHISCIAYEEVGEDQSG